METPTQLPETSPRKRFETLHAPAPAFGIHGTGGFDIALLRQELRNGLVIHPLSGM